MSSIASHASPARSFSPQAGGPQPSGRLLPPGIALNVGTAVTGSDGSRHRLMQLLGSGGEGSVFLTDTGLACKVYASARLTTAARDKILKMAAQRVEHPGLCWPRAAVFDANGSFVGYLMQRAEGKELQKTVFLKPVLHKTFPKWTRRELVTLAETIVTSVHVLHARNVLLGDINPLNFLVRDEHKVFLVDTDSYQFEGHPCPVGTATFLAPELAGADLSHMLRTAEHEAFALATLVFMILMPGKPPYSHCGGGDPRANVLERHFPYCLGDRRSQGVPVGPWRFIWSHFPRFLKEEFHGVFSGGPRPTAAQWLQLLSRYRDLIDRGHATNDLFPAGFRQLSQEELARKGAERRVCRDCSQLFLEFPDRQVREAICPACVQSHRAAATQMAATGSCKQCGSPFTVSEGELAFFRQRNLTLPRRCRACRAARRVERTGVASSVRPTASSSWSSLLCQIFGGQPSRG